MGRQMTNEKRNKNKANKQDFFSYGGFVVFFHTKIIHFFSTVYNVIEKCIIAAMDLNDINERIDKAMAREKSFQTNRTLSGLVGVFIGYQFYKAVTEDSPALWFYIVMGLFVAVAVVLVVFDTKRINQAKAELEELRAAKEAVEADLAELEDDSDESEADGDDTSDVGESDGESDEDDAPAESAAQE